MDNIGKNDIDDNLAFSRILIALFVVVLTIVIFFIYKSRRPARRLVLLTGLCNSGKTLLFSRLVHKRFVNTHTSMRENIGDYVFKNSALRLVDIPGHERVREKYFEKYKGEAKAIVYVIDSTLIHQEIRDIAEYLYNILSDPEVLNNKFRLLILCNKQDIPMAKNNIAIRSLLEKELTTLQRTKSSQLDSVDPNVKRVNTLLQGEKFDFSLLPLVEVMFLDAHATNGTKDIADIDDLEGWLTKLS